MSALLFIWALIAVLQALQVHSKLIDAILSGDSRLAPRVSQRAMHFGVTVSHVSDS